MPWGVTVLVHTANGSGTCMLNVRDDETEVELANHLHFEEGLLRNFPCELRDNGFVVSSRRVRVASFREAKGIAELLRHGQTEAQHAKTKMRDLAVVRLE